MKLEFVRFSSSETEWKTMEGEARWAFVYWDYLRYVVRDMGWNPFRRVRIVRVREEGETLMIVPLVRMSGRREYRMLGDVQGCDIADALFRPGMEAERQRECVRCFVSRLHARLVLNRIPEGSPFLSGIPVDSIRSDRAVTYVNIPVPEPPESYIPSLTANARQNVRKAYRRMERDGIRFRLEVYRPGVDPLPDAVWEQMRRTYFSRRISKYRKGVFSDETKGGPLVQAAKFVYYITVKRFLFCRKHDSRSLRKEPDALHLVLRNMATGRVMAFMSGFLTRDGSTFSVPRIAIDEACSFYSPGCILIAEAVRYFSGETSVRNLDLSRGDEPYKFKMGGQAYCTHDLIVDAGK